MAKAKTFTVIFIVTLIVVAVGAIALVVIAGMTSNKRSKRQARSTKTLDDQGGVVEESPFIEEMLQEQEARLREEFARQQQQQQLQTPQNVAPQNPPVVYGEYYGQQQQQVQYAAPATPQNPYGTGDPQQQLMMQQQRQQAQQQEQMQQHQLLQQQQMIQQQQVQQQQAQQQQQSASVQQTLRKSMGLSDRLMNPNAPDSSKGPPQPRAPGSKPKVKFFGSTGGKRRRHKGSMIRINHDPNRKRSAPAGENREIMLL